MHSLKFLLDSLEGRVGKKNIQFLLDVVKVAKTYRKQRFTRAMRGVILGEEL